VRFYNREGYKWLDADPLAKCAKLFEADGEFHPGDVLEFGGKRWTVGMTSADYCTVTEIPMREVEEDAEECYEDEITCPYCGYKDDNSFERGESEGEHECGRCSAVFSFEREVSVTYSTKLVKMPEVRQIEATTPEGGGR
jgi:hypothetical protein